MRDLDTFKYHLYMFRIWNLFHLFQIYKIYIKNKEYWRMLQNVFINVMGLNSLGSNYN